MKTFFIRIESSERGLSLIELLVAVAVGLVLMSGIYRVFLTSDTGYRYNEQLARLQENSRYLSGLLGREIRMAGYQGCAGNNFANLLTAASQDDFTYRFGRAIEGFEATSITSWTESDGSSRNASNLDTLYGLTDPIGGSDVLVVRGIDNSLIQILSTQPDTSAVLKIPADTGIQDNDVLMIVNCPDSALFAVYNKSGGDTSMNHPTGTNTPENQYKFDTPGSPFSLSFPAGSEVFRNVTTVYYVRDSDSSSAISPSLYRKVGTDPVEELIPGVENMQVLYGEDTDGDRNVDVFRAANSVANWDDVVAVRVGFLLRSSNEIAKKSYDTANYNINGTSIDPLGNGTPAAPVDDRRLRQVLVTTVGLRNRLP